MAYNLNIRDAYSRDVNSNDDTMSRSSKISIELSTSKKSVKFLTSGDSLREFTQVVFLQSTIWNSATNWIIPEWSG